MITDIEHIALWCTVGATLFTLLGGLLKVFKYFTENDKQFSLLQQTVLRNDQDFIEHKTQDKEDYKTIEKTLSDIFSEMRKMNESIFSEMKEISKALNNKQDRVLRHNGE